MPSTVRKNGSWWVIERDGTFLQRARSKKLAVLTGRLLDGDITAAPDWYRATIAEWEKRQRDHAGAIRYAVLSAQTMGLKPDHVRADTAGNPID